MDCIKCVSIRALLIRDIPFNSRDDLSDILCGDCLDKTVDNVSKEIGYVFKIKNYIFVNILNVYPGQKASSTGI